MSTLLQNFIKVLLFIALTLGIISMAAKFTLNFKPLYYYDINYLNIEETTSISSEDIKANYDYLIQYIEGDEDMEFKLPTLPSSETGIIHFKEVKDIFKALDKIVIASLIVTFLGFAMNLKNIKVLKHVSTLLISIPIILSVAFAINFNYSFTLFHKIFFRNDYWVFYPDEDPIINLLPEEFFMHSAILILVSILLIGIVIKLVFRRVNRSNRVNRSRIITY